MGEQKIVYPVIWDYRIIGDSFEVINTAVSGALAPFKLNPLQLSRANESKNGRFISVHLRVEVASQEMRDEIFIKIRKAPGVKMVL